MLTGWLFASSCSPPRLSATQFLSATKGQLPLRSGLSPNCCCVLVGALAAMSPSPGELPTAAGTPPLQSAVFDQRRNDRLTTNSSPDALRRRTCIQALKRLSRLIVKAPRNAYGNR